MVDRFYIDVELPDVGTGTPPAPEEGFVQVYGKGGKLAYQDPLGNEVILDNAGGGGVQSIVAGTGIAVDNTDPQNPIVSAVGGASQRLTLEARNQLIAYKVLTTDQQGFAIYADAGTLEHADQVVGVGTNSGDVISIAENGEVTNSGWNWIAGQPLFLGLNGDISAVPRLGVFNVQIGYARTPTSIIVKIGRSIILR